MRDSTGRLLGVKPTAATQPAWQCVATAVAGDAILKPGVEIAFQRLVDEVVADWHAGDRICRWRY